MSKKRLEEIETAIRKLDRIDGDLEVMSGKGGSIPSRLLERPAKSLGFTRAKKRTGEPMWKHPDGFMTAIPSHPQIRVTTAKKIIAQLQGAIFKMRETLQDEKNNLTKQKSQFGARYE